MKIVEQKWSLSEDDLGLLAGDPSGIILKLLKHKVDVFGKDCFLKRNNQHFVTLQNKALHRNGWEDRH